VEGPQGRETEIHDFLDDLELGKVNRGKCISPLRQLKYLHALRAPLEFFHKPTARLALRDVEQFERALSGGKLANHFTGKPFAHNTQVDMRTLLKIFLRWRLGAARAEELAGWLDTRSRPKTPEYLKEAEVECLYSYCRTAAQKFLVAVLFDSGARAEEFHNIRFEDKAEAVAIHSTSTGDVSVCQRDRAGRWMNSHQDAEEGRFSAAVSFSLRHPSNPDSRNCQTSGVLRQSRRISYGSNQRFPNAFLFSKPYSGGTEKSRLSSKRESPAST